MSLILLRHTKPEGADGLCYGRTDLPLDSGFGKAASGISSGLPQIAKILTSPLTRCRMLAEHIARARNLAFGEDMRIAEMDFGDWENHLWDDIPRSELDVWAGDFLHARTHGGESVQMLRDRVQRALNDAAREPGKVLWVTHSGVIRAACDIVGIEQGWDTKTGFGCWQELPET